MITKAKNKMIGSDEKKVKTKETPVKEVEYNFPAQNGNVAVTITAKSQMEAMERYQKAIED